MDFIEWLKNSWAIIVAIIGGITLIWNFRKIAKDIKASINKPIDEVKNEIKEIKETITNKEGEDGKVINALQSMQRTSLLDSFTKCLNQGYITVSQLEALTAQYNSYTELGGNSFIHSLWSEIKDLRVCVSENEIELVKEKNEIIKEAKEIKKRKRKLKED